MSTVRRIPNRGSPPKSNKGLIIGIIVAIVVVIIVVVVVVAVLLVRRNRSAKSTTTTTTTTTTTSGCVSDAGCPAGKVCNTANGVCVQCMTNSNCTGTNGLCQNNVCVAGCVSDANCTGTTPKCETSSSTCVGCLANADCASGTVCKTANHTCVQCLSDLDCGLPFTCLGDACCNTQPPNVTAVSTMTWNIPDPADPTITVTYSASQAVGTYSMIAYIYTDNNGILIGTSAPKPITTVSSTVTFQASDFSPEVVIFPNRIYKISFKTTGTCGTATWTSTETSKFGFTIPTCSSNAAPIIQSDFGTLATGVAQITITSTTARTVGIALSDVNGFDPNEGKWVYTHLTPTTSTFNSQTYTVTLPAAPAGPTLAFGDPVYYYIWFYPDSANGYLCNSDPSFDNVQFF